RIHNGEKPYKCSICGEAFSQSSLLITHMITHTEEFEDNPYQCSQCNEEFDDNDALQKHLKGKHPRKGGIKRSFRCRMKGCKMRFVGKANLLRHKEVHTGKKLYRCSDCEMSFSDKLTRNNHARIHNKCGYCEKYFKTKSILKNHITVHTGDRPFKCDQCDKTFLDISHLNTHMKIHIGEKTYKCTQCDKAFLENHQLKKHLRVHSGEKPFQCIHCQR
ncbi:unnamed protein product, partial [Meganyctiphanes norvegica]